MDRPTGTDDAQISFYEFCQKKYCRSKTSPVASKAYIVAVAHFLSGNFDGVASYLDHIGVDNKNVVNLPLFSQFKFKVKKKRYFLTPEGDVAVVDSDESGTDRHLKVVPVEDFYDVIFRCHSDMAHVAGLATFKKIKEHYFGIPLSAVREFISRCEICQLKAGKRCQAPVKQIEPIISQGFLERVQIGIIDMRTQPSDQYNYIFHCVDHFSKFHFLSPLTSKSECEINSALSMFLGFFGMPKIIQVDNSPEYSQLQTTIESWRSSGHCQLIRGKPGRHKLLGAVERHHRTVRHKIAIMKIEKPDLKWHQSLPQVMYCINVSYSSVIKTTPYEVVFGINPPALRYIPRVETMEATVDDAEESSEVVFGINPPASRYIPRVEAMEGMKVMKEMEVMKGMMVQVAEESVSNISVSMDSKVFDDHSYSNRDAASGSDHHSNSLSSTPHKLSYFAGISSPMLEAREEISDTVMYQGVGEVGERVNLHIT